MRKATQERCGYETQYQWYMFKISVDSVSLKRCMQALVPLSSMEVDEVYDGRYSYAWCYEVKYVVISAEEHIYNDEQAEILVTDHSGNHHRRKHINTKIYGVRDAVLNGDE